MIAMDYDEIVEIIQNLNYRDKLRLAQLLIQKARAEEESKSPDNPKSDINSIVERVLKSRPLKY
jgi:hypothetical protein